MSEELELKPCPFCGSEATTAYDDELKFLRCNNQKCGCELWSSTDENWNTRPIEDQLRAQLAEAQAKVERYEAAIRGLEKAAHKGFGIQYMQTAILDLARSLPPKEGK